MNQGETMDAGAGLMTTVIKGTIGTVGPIMLAVVHLPEIELWMRLASLAVGITVGVLTIVSIARNLRKNP
jgi:hypothetical protein